MCTGGQDVSTNCPHIFVPGDSYYLHEYRGMCHRCGGPITIVDPFRAIYVGDEMMGIAFVHAFVFESFHTCEQCGQLLTGIAMYCDPNFVVYPDKPNNSSIGQE